MPYPGDRRGMRAVAAKSAAKVRGELATLNSDLQPLAK
jgi:hypothetical protein